MTHPARTLLLTTFTLFCLCASTAAFATSSNRNHELGVYSLYHYGFAADGTRWKGSVPGNVSEDPAQLFWEIMTSGASSEYAHSTSRRRVNEQVNIHTILPIVGDGWKDWDQFDMVFFYGHNNFITPPHPTGTHSFWSNTSGAWDHVSGSFTDWGTPALPYEYYHEDITIGPEAPAGVVYLHEPYTSILLGYHFKEGTDWGYQTTAQDMPDGNSPGTMGSQTFTSGLGTNDLEWLILHGCQSVITSNETYGAISAGTEFLRLAVRAYRGTYDGFHIILGHYRSRHTGVLGDLVPFADNLLAGMPVQSAYFLTDVSLSQTASAVSAECVPGSTPDGSILTEIIENGYMNNDTWTQPLPDNRECSGRRIWYNRWIRSHGGYAYDW